WVLGAGCWVLGTGYWVLTAEHHVSEKTGAMSHACVSMFRTELSYRNASNPKPVNRSRPPHFD
ncbi:hypothetical protein N9L06_05380, partial [Mariniblastus sp.]|nr:hypothetical protein [Mariniblastus sp.]